MYAFCNSHIVRLCICAGASSSNLTLTCSTLRLIGQEWLSFPLQLPSHFLSSSLCHPGQTYTEASPLPSIAHFPQRLFSHADNEAYFPPCQSEYCISLFYTRDLIERFMYLYCTTPRAPIYVILVLNAWDWRTCLNMSGWTLEKLQCWHFHVCFILQSCCLLLQLNGGFIAFSHNTWKIFGLNLGAGTDPCIRNGFWCKSLSNQIFSSIEFYLYSTVAQFPQGIVWIRISRYAALNNFCYTAY